MTEKARKYNSPELQELLDEITPVEMEQTLKDMIEMIPLEELFEELKYLQCDTLNAHTSIYYSVDTFEWVGNVSNRIGMKFKSPSIKNVVFNVMRAIKSNRKINPRKSKFTLI